jgi:hypothetical protein
MSVWRTALAGSVTAMLVLLSVHQLERTSGPPSSTGETYQEECQSEGCDGEEVRELHESYREECLDEGCDIEEVAELAGGLGSVNAMMDDFSGRGWEVNQCTFWPFRPPPGLNNAATGDDAFVGSWCNQRTVNGMVADFDMDGGDWDEGFGWADACNVNLPLARTFNAIWVLGLFGHSMPAGSSNWLPWFYDFASSEIDELDGRCGSPAIATTVHGPIIDNFTELYWPFFYDSSNVPNRAGTLVHEARHADGFSHDGESCPREESCDEAWNSWGANTYQVLYLWWLRVENGGLISGALSGLARDRANTVLERAFDSRPTRGDVWGAGTPGAGNVLVIP